MDGHCIGRSIPGTFFPAEKGIRSGVLTVEAAITLPLFIMVIVAVYTVFGLLSCQVKLQSAMEKAAERMAVYYYAADELLADPETEEAVEEKTGSAIINFAVTGAVAKALVLEEMDGFFADSFIIKNGTDGISFLGTMYREETDDIVLRASYEMNVPFFSALGATVQISQQSVHRAWVGKTPEASEEEEYVYITPNGTAYHKSLGCHYLKLSIRSVSLAAAEKLRNEDEGKYYPCEVCGEGTGDTVYITSYGDCYHFNRNCPGLKRTIYMVPISEAEGRTPCSKCAK